MCVVKEVEKDKHIVVIYKELNEKDGFIITAYLTRRKVPLEREKSYGSVRSRKNASHRRLVE